MPKKPLLSYLQQPPQPFTGLSGIVPGHFHFTRQERLPTWIVSAATVQVIAPAEPDQEPNVVVLVHLHHKNRNRQIILSCRYYPDLGLLESSDSGRKSSFKTAVGALGWDRVIPTVEEALRLWAETMLKQ